MGILNNIFNGVIDIVKLAIIALVCLVVLFIGGYLIADFIGLIPEATGLHRSLSVQTFLTDLPFVGNNMIYLIIGMTLLVIIWIAIEVFDRKRTAHGEVGQEQSKSTPDGAADKPEHTQPEAPEIRQ